MITLRGIGWDHPRCMAPLRASVPAYQRLAPEVEITWDTRSLSHFSDGDLSELLDYDLVVFDHPYCGQIAREGWFIDYGAALPAADLERFAADSLGKCWESYHAGGGIWALPIDAAAQVASYRPELMDRLDAQVPRSLDEVLQLGERGARKGLHVGFPFFPIDAVCTFLTLCANAGFPVSRDQSFFPDKADTVAVLEAMRALAGIAHPASATWNPIRAYEHMSRADDLCYIPYAFSYSNYSRPGQARPLRCTDIPGLNGTSCAGSILGGAGIGISRRSRNPQACLDYARFLCSPEYQAEAYYRNGGQPASLTAWTDAANDRDCLAFFSGTIETMRSAYLRPTFDGYIGHCKRAGRRIKAYLEGEGSAAALAAWLRDDYFG